jgi:NAD(P) transhydrogenase
LGTIPSKALRHSVRQIMQFNTNPMFRAIGEPRWFSFPDVLKSAEKVISKQVASRTGYYARNRVDVFFGTGSFADEQTIEVVCANGVVEKLVAKHIIIALIVRPTSISITRVSTIATPSSASATPRANSLSTAPA